MSSEEGQRRKRKWAAGALSGTAVGAATVPPPELAYLPRPSMIGSADAWVVAQCGARLRVHSQVLEVSSPVLEEAFMAQREGGTRTPRGDSDGAEEPATGILELYAPFSDFSAHEVTLWLLLAYSPDRSLSSAQLEPFAPLLPGVLRLSHVLQAEKLVFNLCSVALETDLVSVLVEMIEIADACQLEDAKSAGLARLCSLFRQPWRLTPADGRAVAQRLGRESLAVVLDSVVGSMRTGSFVWAHELLCYTIWDTTSPAFSASGLMWQLKVREAGTTHLALLLVCCAPQAALPQHVHFTLTVLADRPVHHASRAFTHIFTPASNEAGSEQFMLLPALHDKAFNFLEGGCLRISVHLTLI